MTDLLVIGGGAAGLMAAGAACARGLTVTVLEHNPKGPGQKLLITGKGRCNVTSDSDVREFLPYVRHNGRFLYSSLYAFPPSAAMELFESLGVPLKTERGRRVFPQSDRAADVLAALRDYARDAEFVRGSAKKLLIEDRGLQGCRHRPGRDACGREHADRHRRHQLPGHRQRRQRLQTGASGGAQHCAAPAQPVQPGQPRPGLPPHDGPGPAQRHADTALRRQAAVYRAGRGTVHPLRPVRAAGALGQHLHRGHHEAPLYLSSLT